MKRVKIALAISTIVLVVLTLGAWALARSSEPAVPIGRDLEREDPVALREIIRQIGDPRALEDGQLVALRLDAAQISAVLAEASARRPRMGARAEVHEGRVDVIVSAESPIGALTPYVNLYATVSGPPSELVVESARIGDLPVPAFVGQMLLARGRSIAEEREPMVGVALSVVQDVVYEEGAVSFRVRWESDVRGQIVEAGRAMVLRELGTGRLLHYVDTLRRALDAHEGETRELVDLLTPLAAEARSRASAGEDDRLEFDAMIVVLTTYVLHMPLQQLLGGEAPDDLPRFSVMLHERDDLPRHYLVSASASLFGDRPIADALGLAKELRDADDADGSGFSFRDLMADRAGARMGEAVDSDARVQALVGRLASPMRDTDLVPAVDELPEGMHAAAFEAAYRDTESAAYRALVAQIDAAIEQTAAVRAIRR